MMTGAADVALKQKILDTINKNYSNRITLQ